MGVYPVTKEYSVEVVETLIRIVTVEEVMDYEYFESKIRILLELE